MSVIGVPAQLFFTFLQVSFISFGGVVSVLPELERMIVSEHRWLTHDAFMQSYVLAQLVPGPNVALCPMLGYRIAGWPGFAAGFLGIYTAPIFIMGATFTLYHRYRGLAAVQRAERAIRPLILGLLLAAATRIYWTQSPPPVPELFWLYRLGAAGLIGAAYAALFTRRVHPLLVVFLSGAVWLAVSGIQRV